MRVALFSTCIGDALFPDAHKASALVLTRLGFDVVVPEGQTCCGQMHVNTGYQRQAVPIIETYVDAFSDPSIDYVVAPSGSCAGAVRHQHERLASRYGSPGLAQAAAATAKKTYELTEFIVDVAGTTELGAFFPHRVTYHESCHSKRILGVGERPYQLLRNVDGLELVDLPLKEECCGFGGTFALKMSEVSAAMVADKARHIKESEAEYVTAGDSSCLMNIAGALSRQHLGVRALHIAEILASTKDHPWTPTSAAYSREAML
ncbi:(Fe-S)-binding protein [Corynebacterium timonense]|uniref:L-lactate dehydrogenase complex protein LldE n=1 Tax=Corynebacterium timonense TaxID=441500 RepID=A0A1H1Q704_9CORY|nr:(Fe-S)-binding protein [Corynebacterium timonense]SDS19206.1 L-lactate dehydrogenase complex protein LldE [Corynebacterium timonense]